MAQVSRAALFDDAENPDAYPAPTRQVHARFHRKHHARFEGVATTHLRQPRRLVHLEADAVPEAVREGLTVTGAGNDLARERIALFAGHPRTEAALGVLLCFEDQGMQLHELLVARFP